MKTQMAVAALFAAAGAASANVVVSEIHANATGVDAEYIEIYNDGFGGGGAMDISGWSFEVWDSDTSDGDFGTLDFSVTIDAGTVLAVGDTWTIGSAQANIIYGAIFNQAMDDNSLENDSSTYVWRNDGGSVVWTAFTVDPGEGPAVANIGGVAITPDVTFGPDGNFMAPGYYRTDAAGSFVLTDFGDGAPNDPGVQNYAPVPAPASAAILGLGGLAAMRRRR